MFLENLFQLRNPYNLLGVFSRELFTNYIPRIFFAKSDALSWVYRFKL